MEDQRNFKINWDQNQKVIAAGLFLIGKTFQEIADELNKYIKRVAEGYDTWPYRSDRAVAFQCMNMGLISKEQLEAWDNKRTKKRIKDRNKDYYAVRKKVFDRDGNKCVICESPNNLNFSHVISFRQTRLNIEKEAITLCNKHHKMFDKQDNEITKKIFEKMCSYYDDYKKDYSLEETSCPVHGKHVRIERGASASSAEKQEP